MVPKEIGASYVFFSLFAALKMGKITILPGQARCNLLQFRQVAFIEGLTVANVILVVRQAMQNLQLMYGKNHEFDAS